MTYEEFKESLLSKVNERLQDTEMEAVIRTFNKNNGIVKEGLVCQEPGNGASPVIYLDGVYMWYKESQNMENVVDRVLKLLDERLDINLKNIIGDWDEVKTNIGVRLINYEWNKEKLQGIPYKKLLDLAIVPFLNVEFESGEGSGTALVNEQFLKNWGIDESTLWKAAGEWLEKEAFEYKGIMELLTDAIGECDELLGEKCKLYFYGNQSRAYGAVAILRTDILEEFAEKIDGSFYIIPSSVHELLLLPANGITETDELKEMISMVNNQEVQEEERLSYNLYYYDRDSKRVEIR